MARWIAVRKPFDYHWPGRAAVTAYKEPGDYFVKDEIADFAVAKGYATEGKVDDSSRSTKGTKRVRKSREKPAAETADTGKLAPVGDESAPNADWPIDRPAVDDSAG